MYTAVPEINQNEWTGPSRAAGVVIGNLIPQIFASMFVVARLYTRARLLRSWGPDDTTLLIAWLVCLTLTILKCASTAYGDGHHILEIPKEDATSSLLMGYVGVLLYQTCGSLTKISICLSYLRLFIDRQSRVLLWVTIAFITLYTIPNWLIWILQCNPVRGFWDRGLPNIKCIDIWPGFLFSAVMNIAADIWLIGFVAVRIWGLSLPRKQKIVLVLIITCGWLVVVAAIIRVAVTHSFLIEPDFTWYDYQLSLWASIELCTGLFCCSAPIIKPLVQKFSPSFLGSSVSEGTNSLNIGNNSFSGTSPNRSGRTGFRAMHEESNLAITKRTDVEIAMESRDSPSNWRGDNGTGYESKCHHDEPDELDVQSSHSPSLSTLGVLPDELQIPRSQF